jgi:hypothetical protein
VFGFRFFFLNVCSLIHIVAHVKTTHIYTLILVCTQNKRNRIEISKLQVSVLEQKKKKKTSAAADQKVKENVVMRSESKGEVVNEDAGGGGGGGGGGVVKSSGGEDAKQAERIERRRRKAKTEMQALKKAMHQVAIYILYTLHMCQPLYVNLCVNNTTTTTIVLIYIK